MIVKYDNTVSEEERVFHNVKKYTIGKYETFVECENADFEHLSPPIIFVIAESCDPAFAHWIYETFIFILKDFQYYKNKYGDIWCHYCVQKTYRNFFVNKMGIPDEKISVEFPLPKNNICIFPPKIDLHDNVKYIKIIESTHLLPDLYPLQLEKNIDVLIMPRQTKENYPNNDRQYRGVKNIHEILSKKYSCSLLETDNVKDLDTQVNLLKRSKIVIVTYGSPYFVNCVFMKNQMIVLLGTYQEQYTRFKWVEATDNFIRDNNKKFMHINLDNVDYSKFAEDISREIEIYLSSN